MPEKLRMFNAAGETSPEPLKLDNAAMEALGAIKAQNAAIDAKLQEAAKKSAELDGKLAAVEGRIEIIANAADKVKNDPKRGYNHQCEFFMDVMDYAKNRKDGKADPWPERLRNAVGSDESSLSADSDHVAIPPEFFAQVVSADPMAIQMDIGARTRRIPMNAGTIKIDYKVDKNHATSVTGGQRVYRRAEAEAAAASKNQFKPLSLEAMALMGMSYATEELLRDSPISVAAMLQQGFRDEMVSKLNNERIRGTGVGEYLGILNSAATITIAKETAGGAQTADTINSANVLKMKARCWGYNNAVWMVNQDCQMALTGMHIAGTNSDQFIFVPGNGVNIPDTLLGRPVIYDENMSTLGDLGDIALVNWQEYIEGFRGGMEFAESVHVRFEYNERTFRFLAYCGGAPWWDSALTPKNSAATLSPIVVLAARA